jgi:hypothetical protein
MPGDQGHVAPQQEVYLCYQARIRCQVGPEVGPTSAVYRRTLTGIDGPTGIFRANLTPLSLQADISQSAAEMAYKAATAVGAQVRKMPSWSRSYANFSLF